MARLSEADRNRIIGMLQAGLSKREVARRMNCTRATIYRTWARFQQLGNVRDLPRSGRPKVTTRNQDRYIRLTHARDRFKPATETARQTVGTHNRHISDRTVRRRLSDGGMKLRRPYVGPVLTRRHRRNCETWALNHRGWARQQWASVLFSDESKFNVSFADGRRRVYRRRGERYSQCCVLEADRWGGGNVTVWGGISSAGKTLLHVIRGRVNAVNYRDDILQPIVVPFMHANGLRHFQHDNARPHTARLSTDFLRQQQFNVMPWPSLSPDLNPIEHLWDELGRRVQSRPVRPANVNQLELALQHEWLAIPHNFIQRLINSMRQRCVAVVNARGGHTKYWTLFTYWLWFLTICYIQNEISFFITSARIAVLTPLLC